SWRHVNAWATLNRCFVEIVFCRWKCVDARSLRAASRFPKHHHIVRISAKRLYVFMYPLQRCGDVKNPLVARSGVLFTCKICQEQIAQKSEAVVACNHNHIVFARDVTSILVPAACGSDHKTAAMVVEHHRPSAVVYSRSPDIKHEAIFGRVGFPETLVRLK